MRCRGKAAGVLGQMEDTFFFYSHGMVGEQGGKGEKGVCVSIGVCGGWGCIVSAEDTQRREKGWLI